MSEAQSRTDPSNGDARLRISVVIPTRHRLRELAACLSCLAPSRQTIAADEYEVIVTDDGQEVLAADTLAEQFPWVRWTNGPRHGPAANRNHGATLARGEWLAFTDDDCLPDAGWLAAFADAACANRIVLEGRTYTGAARAHPLEFSPVNLTGGFLWSCNFAIRRTAFIDLGGFDERFPFNAMEDVEFAVRLRNSGICPVFVSDAAVLHPWRRIENWREHARRHLASRHLLETIHPGSGFPGSWLRILRTYTRIVLMEHTGWILRRPVEMMRVLPGLWRSMAEDVWETWKIRR